MPKRVFWPASMIVLGAILIATRMNLLPAQLWNLWPIILIVVGLGGLLVSDKEDWDGQPKTATKKTTVAKRSVKKTTRRKK